MTAAMGKESGRTWSERQTGYARFDQVCPESPYDDVGGDATDSMPSSRASSASYPART
jgi:hypothetical protein